ncbi:MAG: hypothetical protein HXY38_08520 [Chloroflexi bacterium]|nr:hypothetical protein [Chloroflexota bacterium]
MPAALITQVGSVCVYDVLGSGDEARIEAMLEMYGGLFPQYQHYIPRMRRRAQFSSEHRNGHIVHYWLVEVGGRPAGLRTFRYIRERRCGLAHALAVDPKFRDVDVLGKRLSVFLIYECLAQVIRDAVVRGDLPPFGMVNEVEPDRLMEHYTRNGLVKLPVKYVEPIFPPEVEGRSRDQEIAGIRFSPMHMGFLPNPDMKINPFAPDMLENFVLAFLVDHYGLPKDHPVMMNVLDSIKRIGS